MKYKVIAAVAAAVLLAGCSSTDNSSDLNDDSSTSEARSALVKAMQTVRKDFTDAQVGCWADALIEAVGAKEAQTFAASATDPKVEVSPATEEAAGAALGKCAGA